MTTHELAAKYKAAHDMDLDPRYLRAHDDGLSPDAMYLVSESRKVREAGGVSIVGAVHRAFGETLGNPWAYLYEAVRHMGG